MTRLDLPDDARALLDAVLAISSDLDLHTVLDRIVVAACRMTGAAYGALGVIGGDRTLVDFVTHGLTPEQHDAIGELPRGHGILGLLIEHPEPLRLEQLHQHPRSYGFPEHHPPMESFLGVPVRIRGTVFGNLYLTEKADGAAVHRERRDAGRGARHGGRLRDRQRPRLRAQRAAPTVARGRGPHRGGAPAAGPGRSTRSVRSRQGPDGSPGRSRSRWCRAMTGSARSPWPTGRTGDEVARRWCSASTTAFDRCEAEGERVGHARPAGLQRDDPAGAAAGAPGGRRRADGHAALGPQRPGERGGRAAHLVRRPGQPRPRPRRRRWPIARSCCSSPTETGSPATCTTW